MKRWMKFAILAGVLTMLLIPIFSVVAQEGQGRTWVVDFGEEGAKKDGKMTFQITIQYRFLGTREKTDELTIDVKAGWTPEQKAKALENLLNTKFGAFLIVSRTREVVSVQLKKGATYKGASLIDITGAKLKEVTTGEKGIHVYDDPYISYPEVVVFDIEGTPIDSAGLAILKVGWTYPLVTVNTYGKSPSTIKSELVSLFNYSYDGTGFIAKINAAGAVEIPNVPCQEGITAGADDSALSWTLSMEDPPSVAPSVGGIQLPVDRFGLLAPYIGLALTTIAATVAAAIYSKRVRHRREEQ